MVKLLLLLCILTAAAAAWVIAVKIYKTQQFIRKLSKYAAPPERAGVTDAPPRARAEQQADAEEQRLFDDIAELFMQRPQLHGLAEAEQLQASLLRKMPANSTSQIRKMDLGEWSIYWALGGQSLEYYAGKYGVFYAHVDRFGAERRQEIRVQDSAS